jgi:hypothetical protein
LVQSRQEPVFGDKLLEKNYSSTKGVSTKSPGLNLEGLYLNGGFVFPEPKAQLPFSIRLSNRSMEINPS